MCVMARVVYRGWHSRTWRSVTAQGMHKLTYTHSLTRMRTLRHVARYLGWRVRERMLRISILTIRTPAYDTVHGLAVELKCDIESDIDWNEACNSCRQRRSRADIARGIAAGGHMPNGHEQQKKQPRQKPYRLCSTCQKESKKVCICSRSWRRRGASFECSEGKD